MKKRRTGLRRFLPWRKPLAARTKGQPYFTTWPLPSATTNHVDIWCRRDIMLTVTIRYGRVEHGKDWNPADYGMEGKGEG